MNLSDQIKEEACRLGFDVCGIAPAAAAESEIPFFEAWIAEGYHAGMGYMERNGAVRSDPRKLAAGAHSVISVALNYYPAEKQPEEAPQISFYAYGKDYHIVMKKKLRKLEAFLSALCPAGQSRSFVDTAPVFERYWAWKAGLGWIGKNGCLIIPCKGSFFFLGEIVTTASLPYDSPQKERCGTCTRCLDACPSGALEAPKRLNANKCFSYLTIEHRGDIPAGRMDKLGNRLFGCDTCQTACPWNRFAVPAQEAAFSPAPAILALRKKELKTLSEEAYNRIFAGSPVRRAKYEGLVRNIQYIRP